jgi:hypothetical protein
VTAATQWPRATREGYLVAERAAEYKSEYIDGYVRAMSGASRQHNLLTVSIVALLSADLADSLCEVYAALMRVKVRETGDYTYPDVVVACGDIAFEDSELDTLLAPTVLVEVLSPSTEAMTAVSSSNATAESRRCRNVLWRRRTACWSSTIDVTGTAGTIPRTTRRSGRCTCTQSPAFCR